MEVREAIEATPQWYTVDVLQDGGNDKKRYHLHASTPLDARLLAFALDGGFGSVDAVASFKAGDIELAKSYTTVVEAGA